MPRLPVDEHATTNQNRLLKRAWISWILSADASGGPNVSSDAGKTLEDARKAIYHSGLSWKNLRGKPTENAPPLTHRPQGGLPLQAKPTGELYPFIPRRVQSFYQKASPICSVPNVPMPFSLKLKTIWFSLRKPTL